MIDSVDCVDIKVWAIGYKPWYFSGGKGMTHHVIKQGQGDQSWKWYLPFSVLIGIIDSNKKVYSVNNRMILNVKQTLMIATP